MMKLNSKNSLCLSKGAKENAFRISSRLKCWTVVCVFNITVKVSSRDDRFGRKISVRSREWLKAINQAKYLN